MQLSNSTFRTPLDCAKHLYRNEGVAAFYVSYPTTLLMNIPLAAFNFSLYETLKSVLNPTGEYSPGTHMLAGALSGGTAAAITTPLDVAKVSRPSGGKRCNQDQADYHVISLEILNRHSSKPAEHPQIHGYATPPM